MGYPYNPYILLDWIRYWFTQYLTEAVIDDRSGQLTKFRFVYIPTQTTESKYFLFIKLSLFLSTAVISSHVLSTSFLLKNFKRKLNRQAVFTQTQGGGALGHSTNCVLSNFKYTNMCEDKIKYLISLLNKFIMRRMFFSILLPFVFKQRLAEK